VDKPRVGNPESRIREAAVILAILMIPGCAAKTSAERAGIDQEIARNILWLYHEDPAARFREVRVTCEDRVVTLEGRVTDPKSASDALQIALGQARGGSVVSKLDIRAR
jgi:osmotically-inducible protein OsmY